MLPGKLLLACKIQEIMWLTKYTKIIDTKSYNLLHNINSALWRHQMETFSALLALCEGERQRSPVPLTKAGEAELWCFRWSAPAWTNVWAGNRDTGDLRCNRVQNDLTAMKMLNSFVMHNCKCTDGWLFEITIHYLCNRNITLALYWAP